MESESIPSTKSPEPCGSLATLDTPYAKTLSHLVLLCSQKGFKMYGWQRAKELDADPSGMYRGISDELAKLMKEKNAKTKE